MAPVLMQPILSHILGHVGELSLNPRPPLIKRRQDCATFFELRSEVFWVVIHVFSTFPNATSTQAHICLSAMLLSNARHRRDEIMSDEYCAVIARFEAYYPEIGRAIVSWAFLENEIDRLLIALLYDPKAREVLSETPITKNHLLPHSMSRRFELLKRLARLHYKDEVLAELKELVTTCRHANSMRQRLAHGAWVLEHSKRHQGDVVSYLHRAGERREGKVITPEDISELRRQIADTTNKLVAFHRDHHPEGPLPQRLRKFFTNLAGNCSVHDSRDD